ncbi:hypothetical protein [uncultured Bacteroides sp.]|uniref:hypothetical protein n=1 Tax=uncultured Bacteroides sp. TaxID=162156 RepID=UPI002AAC0154|nr:hypothetical protein [uncultured Bacteroides sp.]
MFICAMMFISAQAINAAEKTASDETASQASKECVSEKAEAPSPEAPQKPDYTVVLSSCGIQAIVRGDQSKAAICRVMDNLEKQCEKLG